MRFEAAAQLQEGAAVLADHLAAHAELRTSALFGRVLAGALALGNFLNHDTRLGGASGFRLKNLPKLQVGGSALRPARDARALLSERLRAEPGAPMC